MMEKCSFTFSFSALRSSSWHIANKKKKITQKAKRSCGWGSQAACDHMTKILDAGLIFA